MSPERVPVEPQREKAVEAAREASGVVVEERELLGKWQSRSPDRVDDMPPFGLRLIERPGRLGRSLRKYLGMRYRVEKNGGLWGPVLDGPLLRRSLEKSTKSRLPGGLPVGRPVVS